MKAFMAILVFMALGLGIAVAAPAAPVWKTFGEVGGVYGQNISATPPTMNWAFPMSENWWVTAGYRGGLRQPATINAGAAYSVSPNLAVSIGYILETNYDLKNAMFRTQLDIYF